MFSPLAPAGMPAGKVQRCLERTGKREDSDAATGILGLASGRTIGIQGVREAIELGGATITLRAGIDISRANHPATEVLGHANLPVGPDAGRIRAEFHATGEIQSPRWT